MSQFADKSIALAKPRRSGKGRTSIVPARRSSMTTIAKTFGPMSYKKEGGKVHIIFYKSKMGVDEYVRQVARATPMQIVEIERVGVIGSFIKDLSKRMGIPSSRIFTIFGIPKATAEKKAAIGEMISGSGGQAAIGMVKLLGIAQEIVDNSTAKEAKDFDAAKWLGQWIERPQPSLGGRKPADLLNTPTGVEIVARLLGSIQSGSYQ